MPGRQVARLPTAGTDPLGPVGGQGPAGVIRELARDLLRHRRLDGGEAGRIEAALRDHDWTTVRTYIERALARGAGAVVPAQAVAPDVAAGPAVGSSLPTAPGGPEAEPACGPAVAAAAAAAPAAPAPADESVAIAGLLRIVLQLFDALPRLMVHDADLADRLVPIRALLSTRHTRERLEKAEAKLAGVLDQQIAVQLDLNDTRSSINDMLGLLLDRLGSVGSSTERFQEQVAGYQKELGASPDAAAVGRVVAGLRRDTQVVCLQIRQSQEQLADARHKVEAYEMRVRALERELAQTSRMVQNDPLTHALNRRGLDEVFRIEVARATRYKVPLAVVMIDLDDFKIINDTLGHAGGDRALIHFVTTAQACLRPTELIARTGGEEFVVVFPATAVENAVEAVRRLQRDLARNEFVHDESVRVLTFSGGATAWVAGDTLAQSLQRADAAMYAAKRAGKNRVVIG